MLVYLCRFFKLYSGDNIPITKNTEGTKVLYFGLS